MSAFPPKRRLTRLTESMKGGSSSARPSVGRATTQANPTVRENGHGNLCRACQVHRSRRQKRYTDPSGGATSGDAYTVCIGHKAGERLIVDVVRGRQGPFDPQQVTAEYATLCRQYRVNSVTGDRYGKQWVQQAWRDLLGTYNEAGLYAWQLFLEALAPFNRRSLIAPSIASGRWQYRSQCRGSTRCHRARNKPHRRCTHTRCGREPT
jgi:hypothetical protein